MIRHRRTLGASAKRRLELVIALTLSLLGPSHYAGAQPNCRVAEASINACDEGKGLLSSVAQELAQFRGNSLAMVTTIDASSGTPTATKSQVPVGKQTQDPALPQVFIDSSQLFQKIEGFGGALTQSCVANLVKLSPGVRHQLLTQMFSPSDGALSYLRVPVGASDFSTHNYTYADNPTRGLAGFSIARDQETLDTLKEIEAINPQTQIMLSAWSPPRWMKDSGKLDAGHLKPEDYETYAQYLIKTILAYKAQGLTVNAITIANEPHFKSFFSRWNSLQMSPQNENDFVLQNLAPALKAAGLSPAVYMNDHNYDFSPEYARFLQNPALRSSVAGLAYHCYGGTLSMAAALQAEFPGLEMMNTECTATTNPLAKSNFFPWWIDHQGVSAQNAGFSGDIGWNLCLDQNGRPINEDQTKIPFIPATNLICKNCRGMVTIDQSVSPQRFTFNPEFLALSMMARVEDQGAHRIAVELPGKPADLRATAVLNPDGSFGAVIENRGSSPKTIQLQTDFCQTIQLDVPAKGATSVRW